MALWTWYEFKSHKGNVYRVEIHGDAAVPTLDGEPKMTMPAGEQGFLLEYDGRSQDPFQRIVGSKVTLPILTGTRELNAGVENILNTEQSLIQAIYTGLATQPEGFFTVAIYSDPDDENELFWCGVLIGEQVTQANEPLARIITFTAVDDLANLFYLPYTEDDGDFYTGGEKFINGMIKCLRKVRSNGFWASADPFIATQRYFNTAAAIADGNADPLDYHRYIAEDMLLENRQGVKSPRSCGEVLEAIADTFMASIYLSKGKWYFIPRCEIVSNTAAQYQLTTRDREANIIGSADQFTLAFQTIPNTGQVLTGGSESFLHPVRQVTREYVFAGTLPVVNTGLLNLIDNVIDVVDSSQFFSALQGTTFTLAPTYNVQQDADATRTGVERVIRYKITMRVQSGDLYLTRTVGAGPDVFKTIGNGSSVQTFNPVQGGVMSSNGLAWSSTTTDRFELWTLPIDARFGENQVLSFSFEPPPLPSDEVGFTHEVESIEAFLADGTTSEAITTAALADAEVRYSMKIWILQGGTNSDAIGFLGQFDNDARDELELEEAIFGDQQSTLNSRGAIRKNGNTIYTVDEWQRPGSADQSFINSLLVRTHAQARHRARRTERMTVYRSEMFFWNKIIYSSRNYVITSMRMNAGRDEYAIEMIQLFLTGTISQATFIRDDVPPINPLSGNGIQQALQSVTASVLDAEDQASFATNRMAVFQPVGQGGMTLKNAEGDADAVTYTPPSGVTKAVTLPLDFSTFINLASRITVTDERYIKINAIDDVAAIEYDTEFIAPFDGRIIGAFIRVAVGGDVAFGTYKNGVALEGDTDAFVADTVGGITLDAATFETGDVLAFSIQNTTSAPLDTNVTVILAAY